MNKLDKVIAEIANQEVPERQLETAAERVRTKLFGEAKAAPDRLRSCTDFQAIIPAYLDRSLSAGRSLLLQDHTRECIGCRKALDHARSGVAPSLVRPRTAPTHTISKAWGIAAMAVITLGLGAWMVNTFGPGRGGQITVSSVNGILYSISDAGTAPIFSGKEIPEGRRVRTAKDSRAIVRLPDGSMIEMNERSELSVSRSNHGSTIKLDRGNIIVQAAKQKNGTLDVLTGDCIVSVKGTVFAVDRGVKGSRVTVVEGSVQVAQGSQSQMLKPGDQVSTGASVEKTPVNEVIAWSNDSARYLALLGEFSIIQKGLQKVPSPNLRHESKLLNYLGDDTVLFASIPNLNTTIAEAQRLFHQRLQESEVLKNWWDEQKEGPKLEEAIAKLKTLTDYLGDEVVVAVSGDWDGNYSAPIILADVKRPGLDAFLNNELRALSLRGDKNVPEVVALNAPADQDENQPRRRRMRGNIVQGDRMTIGIKDNVVAIAFSQDQLDSVARRLADPSATENRGNSLLNNVRKSYDQGAGWLFAANMEQIANVSVHRGRREANGKLPRGLEAMRHLIVERKDIDGRPENRATLTFEGRRSGIAAWLAEPAPMGSLDFVSPNATFVVSLAMRSPQWMIGDIFKTLADQDPQFQEKLDAISRQSGLGITPSLAEPLGGDVTFAIDGPLLPLPSWKLIAEVYSPDRMQWGIDHIVQAVNKSSECTDCKITLTSEQVGSRMYYTLSNDKIAYEVDYTFVDGFFVAAPSRALLNRAIQTRETGFVLSRSEAFRSQLPRNGQVNFSAIVFHNFGAVLAPLAERMAPFANATKAQRDSIQALAANSTPGLIYAYGEPDRITVASTSTFFGLDLNSFALPNLIGMGMPKKAALSRATGAPKVQ